MGLFCNLFEAFAVLGEASSVLNIDPFLPLSQWLKKLWQPAEFLQSSTDKLLLIALATLFTIVFLLVFQPYGVNNYDPTHRIGFTLLIVVTSMGLINGTIMFANEFLLAPLMFCQKKCWQLIVWVIWSFLLISSCTFLFYNYLGNFHDWQWSSYFGFLRDVSNLLILPYALVYIFLKYRRVNS